jgi:hypothetical protein
MAQSIEVVKMELNPEIIANFRQMLSNSKDDLAYDQFNAFVQRVNISPTKKLENSYKSLFKALDKFSYKDMTKLLNHRFLFEVLKASPKKRERDLRRIINHYCEFIQSAGSGNTVAHRSNVMRLAKMIEDSVAELQSIELDKKDAQFHTYWIQELRERLDTKDNK